MGRALTVVRCHAREGGYLSPWSGRPEVPAFAGMTAEWPPRGIKAKPPRIADAPPAEAIW